VAIQVSSPGNRSDARPVRGGRRVYQEGSGRSCSLCSPGQRNAAEERINAVKRLAVSTGQLRRLPAVHLRPIDLVVVQEPSS
jgi:hypothetical protein